MTTSQVPGVPGVEGVEGVEDQPSAAGGACPCGHGEVAVEIERQRPLIMRALADDAEAFGALYDAHVDDVYRYLLAWTGDQAAARELTEQVFHGALTWLSVIAGGEGDLGAWLITLARDAVVQHRGTGWVEGQIPGQAQDVFEAVGRLDDAQREVVVLRLLLGHSAAHTAHLAGYSRRVVLELQLAACAAIWQLAGGDPSPPPPAGHEEVRARWFERCLAGEGMDPGADQGLADALWVAGALAQVAPEQVPAPDGAFVARLRADLVRAVQRGPEAASRPAGRLARAWGLLRFHVARHPWAATVVAFTAIGLVLGIQLAGGSGNQTCRGGPCAANTTAAPAPEAGVTDPSLPTDSTFGIQPPSSTTPPVAGGVTTTSTPGGLPATTAPRTTRTTAPPTTVPRTTRTTKPPPTTKKPPPSTEPSTTAPTTTAPTTTTAGEDQFPVFP